MSDTIKPPKFEKLESSRKGRWDEKPVMSGPSTREEIVQNTEEDVEKKEVVF